MTAVIELVIAVVAIWIVLGFVRSVIKRPITIKEETTHGGRDEGSDPADVPAPLKRGPRPRAGAAMVEEPDED